MGLIDFIKPVAPLIKIDINYNKLVFNFLNLNNEDYEDYDYILIKETFNSVEKETIILRNEIINSTYNMNIINGIYTFEIMICFTDTEDNLVLTSNSFNHELDNTNFYLSNEDVKKIAFFKNYLTENFLISDTEFYIDPIDNTIVTPNIYIISQKLYNGHNGPEIDNIDYYQFLENFFTLEKVKNNILNSPSIHNNTGVIIFIAIINNINYKIILKLNKNSIKPFITGDVS